MPQPRNGQPLEVKKRPLTFTKWPARRGRRHHALQSLIFARDPWLVISKSISEQCPKSRAPEALAYLEQARDFYTAAAGGGIIAARPLALYYSFMNLIKAFCLTRGTRTTFEQALHGLKERRHAGTDKLLAAYLQAAPSPNPGTIQNFAEFKETLSGAGLATEINYELPLLVPQVVPGHRFWALAQKRTERFIAVHDLRFRHDPITRMMWLDIYFIGDDLSRLSVSKPRLLAETGLSGIFTPVACDEKFNGRPLLRFEQIQTYPYPNGYPADRLDTVIEPIKNLLWSTVATTPPYRRYYVYMAPLAEQPFVLPQLLSIYAVMFYLGSITRYRPHHYDAIVSEKMGPWIQEFVSGQPLQFLYLMASEFMRQDVTRPAIL